MQAYGAVFTQQGLHQLGLRPTFSFFSDGGFLYYNPEFIFLTKRLLFEVRSLTFYNYVIKKHF